MEDFAEVSVIEDFLTPEAHKALKLMEKTKFDVCGMCETRLLGFAFEYIAKRTGEALVLMRKSKFDPAPFKKSDMSVSCIILALMHYCRNTGEDISEPWINHMRWLLDLDGPGGSA